MSTDSPALRGVDESRPFRHFLHDCDPGAEGCSAGESKTNGSSAGRSKCFFSEKDATAYGQMTTAVARFNRPQEGFEIRTSHGEFVDAVSEISAFVGQSFPLIFIESDRLDRVPVCKDRPAFCAP